MSATAKELRQIIKAALDCHTHFRKATIIENDYFKLGKKATVICQQCVERMEKVLDENKQK